MGEGEADVLQRRKQSPEAERGELPASKTKFTIDEEMRTNTNELDYYGK